MAWGHAHTHTHTQRASDARPRGERALVLINPCRHSSVSVTLAAPSAAVGGGSAPTGGGGMERVLPGERRDDYIFTPCHGDIHEDCVALGGRPLRMGSGGTMPALTPVTVDVGAPLVLPAGAFAWVVWPSRDLIV